MLSALLAGAAARGAEEESDAALVDAVVAVRGLEARPGLAWHGMAWGSLPVGAGHGALRVARSAWRVCVCVCVVVV